MKTVIQKKKLAVILLILCALGYSLLTISIRLMGKGLEPMTQVYLRVFLGFLISILFFRRKIDLGRFRKLKKKDVIALFLMGIVSYSVSVYFITLGALRTTLLNVAVVYSTVTFFAYFYSILVFKAKFKGTVVLLLLLTLTGIVFMSAKTFRPSFSNIGMGEVYVLLSAITLAWFGIGRKLISDKFNDQEITVASMLIAFVSAFILALLLGEKFALKDFLQLEVVIGLIIGAVINFLETYLQNFAFKHVNIVLGNQILLLESFFSLIFGYFFYRELFNLPVIAGALLVIGSIFVINKIA